MTQIYRAATPYLVINGLVILLILWQPSIALYLTTLMKG